MSWTCPGHYKVHGHCPVPLPALDKCTSGIEVYSPTLTLRTNKHISIH